jgi:hypothetical protein
VPSLSTWPAQVWKRTPGIIFDADAILARRILPSYIWGPGLPNQKYGAMRSVLRFWPDGALDTTITVPASFHRVEDWQYWFLVVPTWQVPVTLL